MPSLTVRSLKQGLLLFWALDVTLVTLTNLLDGLKALGLLPAEWAMASGNYAAIVTVMGSYAWPQWVAALALGIVILWEGVAAALFWRARWCLPARPVAAPDIVYPPFVVHLALWAAFLLADEFFIAYAFNGSHAHFFTAELATLLVIVLVPD